ncbi:MAG: DUF6492 family protein [Hylemonella sp.]
MKPFAIYCKSYSVDVKRVRRLALTVEKYNQDKIDFFVSCPQKDLPLFRQHLEGLSVTLIQDEDIIRSNPSHTIDGINSIPGHLSQQIIKSEFWRLNLAQAYLCVDSDCQFIRSFYRHDFVDEHGTPYTIVDECREILIPALIANKQRVIDNFRKESVQVQDDIGRNGKFYNFGPNCPVWHRDVWISLEEEFLKPRKISFADLILKHPIEMRWYGEALLKYRAIPLLPAQPFFKMYAYAWQLAKDRSDGIKESDLAQFYCGVTYQSAWEREMDWPSEGGNWLSRAGRRLRRALGRI